MPNTFETLGTTSTQSPVQPTVYHNESHPMTTHQRAALAQAALVNFFGESGTVTSILNRVQPSHTQTLSEVSDEQDLNISQQGRSLPVSTQTYTIPCISQSTQPTTHTTTEQSTDRQQKGQIIKKSLFSSSQDDISMPTPAEPIKELSDADFAEEQIHLISKLPGQTTDDINIPTRETF